MKTNNIFSMAAGAVLCLASVACDGEKDLIIIDGDLPIKTSTLYLVGDATPNGWSIDSPTPLQPTEADPLIFTWEGSLTQGEFKVCMTTGSWDAPFIRPKEAGMEVSAEPITDAKFKMHAGDPDDKWKVTEAGVYLLSFDLRNWTMSTSYVSAPPAPVIEPIECDALYMVGDATPCGWNIDAPVALEKVSKYLYRYSGSLNTGELKLCTQAGSWDVSFIRPASDGVEINSAGVQEPGFVFTAGPDNKWRVTEAGEYVLEFDLAAWTISATRTGDTEKPTDPIETATLFMIGDATPGGWSMDDASEFSVNPDNKYLFSWTGELVNGTFKACLERDNSFSCPFIRPSAPNVEVSSKGVAADDFVYTTNPDDQWKVTEAGTYTITFDLEHRTIAVKMDSASEPEQPEQPGDEKKPIESATLIMIGDATPGGWSMDNASNFTRDADNKYLFTWEGRLVKGTMKACLAPDGTFSCPFIRPDSDGCKISRDGVEKSNFVFTTDPDDKWAVVDEGKYRITFDLENWTVKADFIE